MDKIFRVYAIRENDPDSGAEAFLDLPASPYELLDAMDKLRLGEGEPLRVSVEEYYHFDCLEKHLSEKYDLPELNALARKLSELDDRQAAAFDGLLKMEKDPIELPRIINLAYSTDCCHVVDEALNDSQLGRFFAENDFVPDVDDLPDTVFDLLDFERIGRELRQGDGGVFVERGADHPGGYVVRHSDVIDAYKTLELTPKAPDYTILLDVSKGFFNDPSYDSSKTVQLKLPASPEALDAALDGIETWDWREAGWGCLDCRVPALIDAISDAEEDIHFLNRMAQRLADMDAKTLTAYKALLEVKDCRDLQTADLLADTLDSYIFSPDQSSPIEVAKGELAVILCEREAAMIAPHLNLYQYGEALIKDCGGALTSYGLIERADGYPIQALDEQPRQGGMEMA